MTNSDKINVMVARETLAESVDLPKFLDTVYEAVMRNFTSFGADDKYDIWPEEITLSSIVVYDGRKRSYVRAMIDMDDEGNVSFTDIERVKKQWVPADDTIQRSAEDESDFYQVEMPRRGSNWATFI